MRYLLPLAIVGFALAGCGMGSAGSPPASTPTATTARVTPAATARPVATPTATVSKSFKSFLDSICASFAKSDAGAIINALPYYQYNSGLRYGSLGDGEGQTGNPSLMRTWLSGRHVHCSSFTPDTAGHGTVLTVGWPGPGTWSLIELDTFQGHWKINDFTFGSRRNLQQAMRIAGPVVTFHG